MSLARRAVLGGIAAAVVASIVEAVPAEELSVDAEDGIVELSRYSADRIGNRPAVLLLHGAGGIDRNVRAYERYAVRLAAVGLDAYLVRYFTLADTQALDLKTTTRETRDAYYTQRFDGWATRVCVIVSAVLRRPECSGRIGLLGFSLGGYVAASAAAQDDRIGALAVLYGGMPDAMVQRVRHLPPVLELHGDADRNVPLAKGEELVRLAKAVGAPAELAAYPGLAHGFDFSETDPVAVDAIDRVVGFFRGRLGAQ